LYHEGRWLDQPGGIVGDPAHGFSSPLLGRARWRILKHRRGGASRLDHRPRNRIDRPTAELSPEAANGALPSPPDDLDEVVETLGCRGWQAGRELRDLGRDYIQITGPAELAPEPVPPVERNRGWPPELALDEIGRGRQSTGARAEVMHFGRAGMVPDSSPVQLPLPRQARERGRGVRSGAECQSCYRTIANPV
jgi:hypothetical protein